MGKSKWRDQKQADLVFNMLIQSKVPNSVKAERQSITVSNLKYKTKFDISFDRCVDLLVANARFNSELPVSLQDKIGSESIFKAADKNLLKLGVVSDYIRKEEKEYIDKPQIQYVLLTTLSIPYSKTLKNITHNKTTIVFCKRKPKGFQNEDAKNMADKMTMHKEVLARFVYVKVKVDARCQESAFVIAKSELDFVVGVWNFTINLNAGIRKTFGIPERINKIVYGPCHTLHREGGARDSSLFWYETHIHRKIKITDISDNYENCKVNERYIRSISKSGPLGNTIKTALIRYGSALDDEDMTGTFLKLWSLLELVTFVDSESHLVVVHRASQVYLDKQFMYANIDYLRKKRNHVVHTGGEFDSSEKDAYSLLQIVNAVIRFLVNNFKLIPSIEEFKDILSLPLTVEEANENRIGIEKQLEKYNFASKNGIYK
ncbi:MAG: hypothetical protein KAT04_13345 [Methylococcales bacterium]|nr:hypothetical protein [Methylococcales bacterium]